MRRLDFSRQAGADLSSILGWSQTEFGEAARHRYQRLVSTALKDVRDNPETSGSRAHPELGASVHLYHLRSSRTRARGEDGWVKAPRHIIAYEFDDKRVLVLRILHEAMDFARHLPPLP